MTVRLAIQEDKNRVLALLDEFSEEIKAKEKPSIVGGEIFDEILKRQDTIIFVAEDNGKLVGLMSLYLLPNIRHGWHRGHIEDVFTTKSVRGQGVGTQIFNFIKDWCKQNNIKVIKLDSANELYEAHKFYEKNGGKQTEMMFRFDL